MNIHELRVHTPWSAFLRSSSRSMAWDHPDDPSWGFHSQKPQRNPAGRFWWGCPWAVGLWQAWLFLKINAHLGFALHFAGEMSEWIWRGKNTPWACQDCCACMAGLLTLAFFSKICQESTTVLQLERASPKTWRISHMLSGAILWASAETCRMQNPHGEHLVGDASISKVFFVSHIFNASGLGACLCSEGVLLQVSLQCFSEWHLPASFVVEVRHSNSYFEGSRRGFNFSASLPQKRAIGTC